MDAKRNRTALFLVWFGAFAFQPLCRAQLQQCTQLDDSGNRQATKPDPATPPDKPKDKITQVISCLGDRDEVITRIVVKLQGKPNSMEAEAEPRRIQVDDRANVQLRLRNLSPFDVCTLNGRSPAPTAETNVAESLTGTIAALGGFGIAPARANLMAEGVGAASEMLREFPALPSAGPPAPPAGCSVRSDPEYARIKDRMEEFVAAAKNFVGNFDPKRSCQSKDALQPTEFNAKDPGDARFLNQTELACQLDAVSARLAAYANGDYRGSNYSKFKLDSPDVTIVKAWYTTPIPTVVGAARLQAMVDEMGNRQTDLHKKYDFKVSGDDSGPAAPPSVAPVNGTPIVMAAPLKLSFTYRDVATAPGPQTIQVSSGGAPATFSVTPSPKNWLAVSAPCLVSPPCRTGTAGTSNVVVTVDPSRLDGKSDVAAILIAGTGGAAGSTIVNVTIGVASPPTDCDVQSLLEVDRFVERAKAVMTLIGSNNTAMQTAQASLKTSYLAVARVFNDFVLRQTQGVSIDREVLVQTFNLSTDRKATITGSISCVSDIDGKTATTDTINYSVLYQNVPRWSASAGLLMSTQQKKIIGLVYEGASGAPYFAVTDHAPAQVFPMAFVNYRFTPYSFHYGKRMSYYGKNKEDTLVWTGHVSAGIGVNPNSGTNQPEFFLGLALGLNRFLIQPGVHIGRMQSLGEGYTLNMPAPTSSGFTVPIDWSYRPAFAIGFSVRLAPY